MNFDLVTKHFTPELIIDIGANVGAGYVAAIQTWPKATVWMIEGNPECEKTLQSVVREGDYLDINLLSDATKEVEFFLSTGCPMNSGASYYRENTPYFEGNKATPTHLTAITLDTLVTGSEFWEKGSRLLIMLDTQGSELDILRGGQETLAKAQGVIIELSRVEYNIGAPLCDEVDAWMQQHGWQAADVLNESSTPLGMVQNDVLYLRK